MLLGFPVRSINLQGLGELFQIRPERRALILQSLHCGALKIPVDKPTSREESPILRFGSPLAQQSKSR